VPALPESIEMDEHSIRVLEYKLILDRLAAHTSNRMGREAALALAPTTYPEMVDRRLQETREARHLLESDGGLPLGGIRDIREAIEHAAIGSRLSPAQLLDVAATCAASRRLKQFLQKRAESCPLLAEIAHNLFLFPLIEQKIEEAISEGGDVRDTATPELARVRSQAKVTHNRIMERLNGLISSERYRTFIQEGIITTREGRYCIPVKAENRQVLGGIVHDASASGATVFVEPAATVEMGNELKDLAIKEDQEVHRILTKLTELVAKSADDLRALVGFLANLDLANAKAVLAEQMDAVEPRLNRKGIVRMRQARHPLLTGDVVPVDLEIGDRFRVLLITGPNTGGKTVSLKTLGLLTLMAQSGLQVPAAADCELAIFDQVFADIGDEQDIQQSLSTFSAHLRNIVRILKSMGRNALVLLDEVGAGTDPAEGAALAKALLNELNRRNARVIATTHYGELKEFAYSHPGVENAAMEFDRETLRPTYRILLGVPGNSNAFYIASRLGLPDSVVEEARGSISARDATTADLLQQIEESRRKSFEMERDAEVAKREAEALRDEYEQRVRQITDVQRTAKRQAEEEARAVLRRATERAENIITELRKMNRGGRKGPSARQGLVSLKREVSSALHTPEPEPLEPVPSEGYSFRRGDRVRVTTLNMDGELMEDPRDGVVTVLIGSMRATIPVDVLRPAKAPVETAAAKKEKSAASVISMKKALYISPELNIRAMRVDEVAPMLDRYMDDAYAAGLKEARIIHGKGTGALRRYVGEYLRDHPAVDQFRLGDETEGGDGATVVTFRT
jgi:DNA mismatch repair protein MutS2